MVFSTLKKWAIPAAVGFTIGAITSFTYMIFAYRSTTSTKHPVKAGKDETSLAEQSTDVSIHPPKRTAAETSAYKTQIT